MTLTELLLLVLTLHSLLCVLLLIDLYRSLCYLHLLYHRTGTVMTALDVKFMGWLMIFTLLSQMAGMERTRSNAYSRGAAPGR